MSQGNAWNNALAAANATTVRKPPIRKPTTTIEHAERVLFCLRLNNPFRKMCIKFVEWK
jgi:hypothetical protein